MRQAWTVGLLAAGLVGCGREEAKAPAPKPAPAPAGAAQLQVVKLRAEADALMAVEKARLATAEQVTQRAKIEGDLAAADAAVQAGQPQSAISYLNAALSELRLLTTQVRPQPVAVPESTPTAPAAGIPGA